MFWKQPSFKQFLSDWKISGNKLAAFLALVNRWPNVTYPGGEEAYNKKVDSCSIYPAGMNDFKCYQIVIWRSFWHLVGGIVLASLDLPLIELKYLNLILPLIVAAGFAYKEFVIDPAGDGPEPLPKALLDWAMWGLPNLAVIAWFVIRLF